MQHQGKRLAWGACVLLMTFLTLTSWRSVASAQQLEAIPEQLRPWIPWVLADRGETACTRVADDPHCIWPGRLTLELTASGGTFEQEVFVESRQMHQLPGGEQWPLDVQDKGKHLAVLDQGGVPHVELTPGSHVLKGQFTWRRLPERLAIGPLSAFVRLVVNGSEVPLVKREGGELWLKGLDVGDEVTGEAEHVEMDVFRKIRDGIPLFIETRLVFQVAGRARELRVANPLLDGTLPLEVSGDLALALEPSGQLRVQLMPGRHEVTLLARSVGMPAELSMGARAGPWPEQEVWVFEPAAELRVVEVSGLPGIDASRTVLPDEWKALSAYAATATGKLQLETTRRGEPQLPPNRIALRREFWLDSSAEAFTVRDTLTGAMHRDWRLDLLQGELGQVHVGGEAQVISIGPTGNRRGIEVRDAELNMVAISKVPRLREISAVGWSSQGRSASATSDGSLSSPIDNLSADLHLPPGWDVFAATGVDAMSDSWVHRWNLFAVFYVLVVTLATSKLVGRWAGAAALIALVLSHAQEGAPQYMWIFLVILSALAQVVNSPRLQRAVRWCFHGVVLLLAVLLVSFAVNQVRSALYPHIQSSWNHDSSLASSIQVPADITETDKPVASAHREDRKEDGAIGGEAEAPPAPAEDSPVQSDLDEGAVDRAANQLPRKRAAYTNSGSALAQKQYQPDAVVQTGPGVPDVVFSTWTLGWSGPVAADHTMRLYLISPPLQRFLTFLRLVALGALAFLLWRSLPRPSRPQPSRRESPRPPLVASVVLLAVILVGLPSHARAEEPSKERLEDLKTRLLRPAPCEPDCLSVSRAKLILKEELVFTAEVHAGRTIAYRLPGPASAFSRVTLIVDGKPSSQVRLEDDGGYSLRLEAGVHEVVVTARLASDRTTLDIGTLPHHVEVEATGWSVSGVDDDGRIEGGTLTLVKDITPVQAGAREQKGTTQGQVSVPPWFQVTRHVSLGVNGRVLTTVSRVSDATSPEELALPLLSGEQVTTAGVEIRGPNALLSFPREVTSREFTSTLPTNQRGLRDFALELESPSGAPYTETWTIECGVVWHCTTTGLSTTSHIAEGRYLETFSPWPGEKLRFSAVQPAAAPGRSLTIESSTLTVAPGIRLGRSRLEMVVRTSRTQTHAVGIPPDARLESVQVDGATQAAKNENGAVTLAFAPGSHSVKLEWQEDRGLTALFRTSGVNLGAPGSNTRVAIEIPSERWLLLAGGPGYGPAILFWGYLLLIVGAALLLPRLPLSPLGAAQWLLLGLGLTQVPAGVGVFVVGWFFLIASRSRWRDTTARWKNVAQVALVVATVLFLVTLTVAVYEGLVSSPDMEIHGVGSHAQLLSWYVDRTPAQLPGAWFFSVSIWVWRAAMLLWALWLARSLLSWLRWAWESLQEGGFWAPPRSPRRRPLSRFRSDHEAEEVVVPAEPGEPGVANQSDAPRPASEGGKGGAPHVSAETPIAMVHADDEPSKPE